MTAKIVKTTVLAAASCALLAFVVPAAADQNRERARENFLAADANQDKQLDADEFKTFIDLNAEDGLGRAGTVRRFGMYARAFGRVDEDQDGFVTPQEMRSANQQ